MEPTNSFAKTAQKGILFTGSFLLIMILFGAGRQTIQQEYLNVTAGQSAETQLVDIGSGADASVEIVAQMQYTQTALFNAEILTASGDRISESSQEFNSNDRKPTQTIPLTDLSDGTEDIQVRLSVASQSVTATPPQGLTASQVPVIFEVNVYRQRLNRSFLWPPFFVCIIMWAIVAFARRQDTKRETQWAR